MPSTPPCCAAREQRLRNLGFFESVDIKTDAGQRAGQGGDQGQGGREVDRRAVLRRRLLDPDGVLGDVAPARAQPARARPGPAAPASPSRSGARRSTSASPSPTSSTATSPPASTCSAADRLPERIVATTRPAPAARCALGYPLTENLRHSVRYTLREDEIHNVDDDASVFIQDEEGDAPDLAGRSDLLLRSPRRALPAVRGLSSEAATRTWPGSAATTASCGTRRAAEYYYSIVPDVVFSLSGSGGYIHGSAARTCICPTASSSAAPILRGFQFGGIGPRDSETDDTLGGNLYYTGSAEVRFPLGPARRAARSSGAPSSTPAR